MKELLLNIQTFVVRFLNLFDIEFVVIFQAPPDVVTSIAEQIQDFVRKKLGNANDVNENRAALLVIRTFDFLSCLINI